MLLPPPPAVSVCQMEDDLLVRSHLKQGIATGMLLPPTGSSSSMFPRSQPPGTARVGGAGRGGEV